MQTLKNILLSVALIALGSQAFCQDWPLKKKVLQKKIEHPAFVRVDPFTLKGSQLIAGKGRFQELQIDSSVIARLIQQRSEAIQLTLPIASNQTLSIDLVRTDFGDVKYTQNRYQQLTQIQEPLCYRGIINGVAEKNNVMFTVNHGYVDLAVHYNNKVMQIARVKGDSPGTFRLYNSDEIAFPPTSIVCGTNKEPSQQALAAIQQASVTRETAAQDKCVYVFVECFDSLYSWRDSSVQSTIDYVYALYNNVATGFLNEQINIKISTINVWTTDDPYRGDNRDNALDDLASYYQDNFWGNICVGLDYSVGQAPRSGIAGDIGRVKGEAPNTCVAYTVDDHPFCYNDLDYNVNVSNFPTGPNVTQQQVYLVMHEMGHLLGSHHTQWCGWVITTSPLTTGALDNCAAVEGTCSPGPPPPASGGTIMSYCVGPGQVTSFNNGFGTFPGNAVRNFVDAQACITNCPTCVSNHTLGVLPAGISHYEASNTITINGAASAFALSTVDAGSRVTLLPGFRAGSGARIKIIINGCGGIR